MVKVMMAAPFEAKGRYQGGISAIVRSVMDAPESMDAAQMQIIPFNTCRMERNNDGNGRLNLENLQNFGLIYRDVVPELRAAAPDVFYLHTSVGLALLKDLLVLRKVKKQTGCKTVLHIHFADIEKILTGKGVLDRWILSLLKTYADGIVFLSAQTMEQFVQQGIAREKCFVIYNFSTLAYTQDELFAQEETPGTDLLFVGSIDDRKGLFDALAVLEELEEPYTLHVCGGFGNDENEALFRRYEEKLGQKLQFHGFVKGEDKRRIFKDCDVLLLPSYGEGLPVVILEAFSAGCGVITTTVGAIPEIVGAENGAVIAPGDRVALKKALQDYLSMDKTALRAQKERNVALAERYTLDMFIHNIAAVCVEVHK